MCKSFMYKCSKVVTVHVMVYGISEFKTILLLKYLKIKINVKQR